MTRKEAINRLRDMTIEISDYCNASKHMSEADRQDMETFDMAIKALEQEPRKDEVILTKEEYGELVSSEFDNGYAKGYREALEQESVLDKIRAEIEKEIIPRKSDQYDHEAMWQNCGLRMALKVIDKYKAESEEE